MDPHVGPVDQANAAVAAALSRQYRLWQPRAKCKHVMNPCVEEVRRQFTHMRRRAKEQPVLFHYNGHGVPAPSNVGEIWIFNKKCSKYFPLSISEVQGWVRSPAIYVYDCSCAGRIVEAFNAFAEEGLAVYEDDVDVDMDGVGLPPIQPLEDCIQFAACGADEILPSHPGLPADLFTACLTTPIETALRWIFTMNHRRLVPGVTVDMISRIPGLLSNRRTMRGQLNWAYTAITDTIAWSVLPSDMFQKVRE